MAVASTVAMAFTAPGQTLLVSLLNVPLRKTLGVEPLWLNSAYSLATVVASLPLVFVGKLVDRFGPRKMLAAIALAFAGACCFMAAVSHIAMAVLAFFLLRFLGLGSLSMVSSHMLAMWFHRRLGTLSGVRSVLVFVSWTPLPMLTLWLFDRFGWRATWALYGATIGLVLPLLAWWLVRNRPEELGLHLDGALASAQDHSEGPSHTLKDALRTRAYWLLAGAGALSPMVVTALIFDLQPLFAARGLPPTTAALAASFWGATMAVLALPSGWLVDRVAPGKLIAAGVTGVAASCLLLYFARSAALGIAALGAVALGNSLVGATVGATAARYFGREHHGAIRSSLGRITVIATGVGPFVFGVSQQLSGAFDAGLLTFVGLCLPALGFSLSLTPPQRSASAG